MEKPEQIFWATQFFLYQLCSQNHARGRGCKSERNDSGWAWPHGAYDPQGGVPDSAALTPPAFALVERGSLERPLVGSTHAEGVS